MLTPARFTIALLLFLLSPLSMAQQADPLWMRAREALLASQNLVAGEVSANTTVVDEEGKNLDTIQKITKLTGWHNNEPVRSTVSLTASKKSGLGELKFEWGVADHPEQALPAGTSIVRVGPAMLDGKTYILFNVDGKKGKRPFKSKVWIDEQTGLPARADFVVDGIPLAKLMSYSVLFGRDEHGRWLPLNVQVDALISAFFFKFRVHSVQRLYGWVKRP